MDTAHRMMWEFRCVANSDAIFNGHAKCIHRRAKLPVSRRARTGRLENSNLELTMQRAVKWTGDVGLKVVTAKSISYETVSLLISQI